jgi:hypothetical protein
MKCDALFIVLETFIIILKYIASQYLRKRFLIQRRAPSAIPTSIKTSTSSILETPCGLNPIPNKSKKTSNSTRTVFKLGAIVGPVIFSVTGHISTQISSGPVYFKGIIFRVFNGHLKSRVIKKRQLLRNYTHVLRLNYCLFYLTNITSKINFITLLTALISIMTMAKMAKATAINKFFIFLEYFGFGFE